MALLPKVKLKAVVSFPATVLDGAGIDVVKANGTYQFNLDFGDFAPPVSSVTDPVNQNALVWNSITNAYALVPISILTGSSLAPATATPLIESGTGAVGVGLKYAREDHVHPLLPGAAPSSANPIMDGVAAPGVATPYSREDHVHPSDTSKAAVIALDVRNFAVLPLVFSTVGTGGDDTATIQAAINAANTANGGTIIFHAATFNVSSALDFTNKGNITLQGQGNSKNLSAVVTALVYTSATGSLFKMDGATGVTVEKMQCRYSSGTYNGDLIDLRQVSGAANTNMINIRDCFIWGASNTAASLVRLGGPSGALASLSVRVERCLLQGGIQNIKGGLNSNNIYIANNFFNQGSSTSHIGIQGEGWTLLNNTFEPSTGTVANNITANGATNGLAIIGNTFNDGVTGTPIVLTGGVVSGLSITGNIIQGGAFSINVGSAVGVSIVGNTFSANNISNLIVSSATNVLVSGNSNAGTLVGTLPTLGTNVIDANSGNGLQLGPSGANYTTLPGKKLMAWGTAASIATTFTTVTLPVTFGAAPTVTATSTGTATLVNIGGTINTTQFQAASASGTISINWVAVGNAP